LVGDGDSTSLPNPNQPVVGCRRHRQSIDLFIPSSAGELPDSIFLFSESDWHIVVPAGISSVRLNLQESAQRSTAGSTGSEKSLDLHPALFIIALIFKGLWLRRIILNGAGQKNKRHGLCMKES